MGTYPDLTHIFPAIVKYEWNNNHKRTVSHHNMLVCHRYCAEAGNK